MKMKFHAVIVAIQIIQVCSANSRIFVPDLDEPLTTTAAKIVDVCLGSSERWSELLIITSDGHTSNEILEKIHHQSKTSNSIVSPGDAQNHKFTNPEECHNYSNTGVECLKSKPTGVIISIHSVRQLESVLGFLKNDVPRLWQPGSYFLIILEAGCDVKKCNDMYKVIWNYWVLNAVILCSANNPANGNQSDIELYTFNPYSADHSRRWETIINETVEVSIEPGNFNHSWYIFKQRFPEVKSLEDCSEIFFDKTSNLDGYVIPINLEHSEILSDTTTSGAAMTFIADGRTLKTIAKSLRFNFVQGAKEDNKIPGQLFDNGSYSGNLDDVYNRRSHLLPTYRGLRPYPGLGITYPHDVSSACFASRIVGIRPRWTNLADAKHIWIALGCGLLFSAAVLYVQNKSNGIVSAFLDAERLVIGSSIIRTSTIVKHRIILGSIFLVVLVVDGAIRGRFISILTVVQPYPNLDTMEQLKEQHVAVYGHRYMKESIMDPELNARLNDTHNIKECLDRLERGEHQRACFTNCRWLEYEASNSTVIHLASAPVSTSYVVFLTAIHWPVKNRYSFEVQKIVEAGLVQKWKLDVYREVEVNSWKVKRAAERPYVKPTKLNDLLPAVVLLSVGLLVAFIVFLWEIKGGKSIVKSDLKN